MIIATKNWNTPILFVPGTNEYIQRPEGAIALPIAAEEWLIGLGYAARIEEGELQPDRSSAETEALDSQTDDSEGSAAQHDDSQPIAIVGADSIETTQSEVDDSGGANQEPGAGKKRRKSGDS